MTEALLVADDQSLARLLDALRQTQIIALDTEFVRERTYYPKLCLVQIATDELTACVDCLADLDLDELFEMLTQAQREWVLHSARQDLEVMAPRLSRMPAVLHDTQIAAALCGHAPQVGLQELLTETLQVRVSKAHTRTDWSRRPLPPAAVEYAFDDVRHLLPLWRALREKLATLGRLEWFAEDCRRLLAEPPASDAEAVWRRLRGLGSLGAAQQRAALALVRWREAEAQRLDRPRRWIMGDALLLRVARRRPRDETSLESIDEMPQKLVRRAGAGLLAAVAAAGEDDGPATASETTEYDKALLARLQSAAKARAEELGLQTEVLATRRQLIELAGRGSPPTAAGRWRSRELSRLLAMVSAET